MAKKFSGEENLILGAGKAEKPAINKNLIIDPDLIEWKEKLGEGGCGVVFKVWHRNWGPMVIKKISSTMMTRLEEL